MLSVLWNSDYYDPIKPAIDDVRNAGGELGYRRRQEVGGIKDMNIERTTNIPVATSIISLEESDTYSKSDRKGGTDYVDANKTKKGLVTGPIKSGSYAPTEIPAASKWINKNLRDDPSIKEGGEQIIESGKEMFRESDYKSEASKIWGAKVNNEELKQMVRDTT